MKHIPTLLCISSALVLSACGLKGGLEQPDPLWMAEQHIQHCNHEPTVKACIELEADHTQSSS